MAGEARNCCGGAPYGRVSTSSCRPRTSSKSRWLWAMTHFLKDLCHRLTLVDLNAHCIAGCQRRFASCDHITYAVNDGTSLHMVPDQSVDFAFSYDSLVHVDADVIDAYLSSSRRS